MILLTLALIPRAPRAWRSVPCCRCTVAPNARRLKREDSLTGAGGPDGDRASCRAYNPPSPVGDRLYTHLFVLRIANMNSTAL